MIKYLKEYRFYITLFLFLLIPLIAIDTTNRAPRDYKIYDRVILSLTSPIQMLLNWTIEQGALFYQNYVYLWNTHQENMSLTEENKKLLSAIANLKETQQENTRLRKLLQFEEKFHLDSIVARVIARDISTDFRAIRINRGDSSGVKKDMAIVTHEGVVGRVLRASTNHADIVTILDPLSAVDSIDERSRARGIVEGKTEETCYLRYAIRTDDIAPGDILVSSGLGGIFPKGVPVGTVSKVDKKPFGISQDVEVKPSVDFSKLEEVIVVLKAQTETLQK